MKITTLGDAKHPVVISIPGMFCDDTSVTPFAQYLQDDYYVIIPTLDGHYPDAPDYTNAYDQAKKLLARLHEMGVECIAMLHGTSMGAEVALAVARESDISIDHYVYDGGPFFNFPKWFKAIMRKKFESFTVKFKGKTPDDVLQDRFVRWIGGENIEDYMGMIDSFVKSADFMTKESVKNIVETCYACRLPVFSEETQRKFLFHFSEKEPAHQSKKRLMKQYPNAVYVDYPGNGHAGFQAAQPEAYARFLESILTGQADVTA